MIFLNDKNNTNLVLIFWFLCWWHWETWSYPLKQWESFICICIIDNGCCPWCWI